MIFLRVSVMAEGPACPRFSASSFQARCRRACSPARGRQVRNRTLVHFTDAATATTSMGDPQLYWYFGCQLLGGGLLACMLVTVLWPWSRVRCNPVLTSFCMTWLLSVPMMCLLLFTRQLTGPQPTASVCAASAALVMSQSHLSGTAGLALVAHVYTLLATSLRHRFILPPFFSVKLLTVIPYIVFGVSAIAIGIVGATHPANLKRAKFYCVYDSTPLTVVTALYDALCVLGIIFFEFLIFVNIRRENIASFAHRVEPSLVWRVLVLGVYVTIGFGLAIWASIDWSTTISDLIFATFGIGMFAVFGTQKAIVERWKGLLSCSCIRPKDDLGVSSRSGGSKSTVTGLYTPRLPSVKVPQATRASYDPASRDSQPLSRRHPSYPIVSPSTPREIGTPHGSRRSRTTHGSGSSSDMLSTTPVDFRSSIYFSPLSEGSEDGVHRSPVSPPPPQKPTMFVPLPPRPVYQPHLARGQQVELYGTSDSHAIDPNSGFVPVDGYMR
ncbi:hypothetical protein BKA62DRAFT_461372 [Auriculariales sp. MPI-PUGE-AT-0066]|nr:hypothetical protein BKA62DRAFT_461372 [Auriculariales sp. MPI-PUGE-AT-0066]